MLYVYIPNPLQTLHWLKALRFYFVVYQQKIDNDLQADFDPNYTETIEIISLSISVLPIQTNVPIFTLD